MGQAAQEVFKDVVRSCKKKMTELDLNMATSVDDNKKCFYEYTNSKRRGKENFCSLLCAEGNVATKDKEAWGT